MICHVTPFLTSVFQRNARMNPQSRCENGIHINLLAQSQDFAGFNQGMTTQMTHGPHTDCDPVCSLNLQTRGELRGIGCDGRNRGEAAGA